MTVMAVETQSRSNCSVNNYFLICVNTPQNQKSVKSFAAFHKMLIQKHQIYWKCLLIVTEVFQLRSRITATLDLKLDFNSYEIIYNCWWRAR